MKLFTIRTTKPNAGNKEYIRTAKGGWSKCCQGAPTDGICDSLANCVGYACGRFNEIYNEIMGTTGMKYYGLNCNAENFIERAKEMYPELQFSDKPQPGAIICWSKGKAGVGSDGAGHVEVVEQVISDEEIRTSASAYNGTAFFTATRKYNNGNWVDWKDYHFRAFILNPAVTMVEPVERDKAKDQIQVVGTLLRMRRTPDDTIKTNIWGTYCPLGIFNIMETKKVKDKTWGDTWYKIDDDVWVAGVNETVKFLAKENDSELDILRKENARLKKLLKDINEMSKDVGK